MEKKQTAVDWLYGKIKSHFEHDGDLFESVATAFSVAKLKERDQIEEADKSAILEHRIACVPVKIPATI